MSQNSTAGMCNNGSIVAQSLWEQDGCYTSQLNVTVTTDMIGTSIECVYDNISSTNTVGSLNITASGKLRIIIPCKMSMHFVCDMHRL